MPLKTSKKTKKNKINKQADACRNIKFDQKCAGCDEKIPEHILDDRQLCSECYKTEMQYCDKAPI